MQQQFTRNRICIFPSTSTWHAALYLPRIRLIGSLGATSTLFYRLQAVSPAPQCVVIVCCVITTTTKQARDSLTSALNHPCFVQVSGPLLLFGEIGWGEPAILVLIAKYASPSKTDSSLPRSVSEFMIIGRCHSLGITHSSFPNLERRHIWLHNKKSLNSSSLSLDRA